MKSIVLVATLFVQILITRFAFTQIKIDIIENKRFGGLEEEAIYQWAGIAVDTKENVYVTDMIDYSIKKFNANGELVKRTGRKGQGPGEFLQIREIVCFNDSLFVTDGQNLGIQIFDTNLKYLGHIKYPNIIQNIEISDTFFLLSQLTMRPAACLISINRLGTVLKEINYDHAQINPLICTVDFAISSQDAIYIAYLFKNKIIKVNRKGVKFWERSLINKKSSKMSSIKNLNFALPEDTFYKSVALDIYGNVFILGGNKSNNKSKDIYVVKSNGEDLCRLTLPESTHVIFIDKHNHLYSRGDQGVSLVKYDMIYSKARFN